MRFRPIETKTILFRPELIPLIGLAFQMLTFFIIVLSFESTKAEERLKLPKDMIARPPMVRPEHELVLRLGYPQDADGSQTAAIPKVYFDQREIDIRAIGAELDRERKIIEQHHGRDALMETTVLIRGEADVPAGALQDLVKRCQDAGFSKFVLHTVVEGSR